MITAFNQTSFVILPITMIGFLVNWSVFYSFLRLKIMRHSFGFLSANQALADALHSSSFLIYFCPMVLFDNHFMKTYSQYCGFLTMLSYETSIYFHFTISLNRFCAAWAPFKYPNIFNSKNTLWMIFTIWVVVGSISYIISLYLCQWKYSHDTNVFEPTDSKQCRIITWYGDFVSNSITVTIFMTLDVLTVFKVRKSRLNGNHDSSLVSKREKRFLKQTVTQGSLFVFELLVFFFVPKFTENRVALFFSGTVAFVAIHMLDGIIVLVCYPESRSYLFGRNRNRVPNTISVQKSVSKY